jgi:hypothetical protein
MTYLQTRPSNQQKKNWICRCGRKNDNDDLKCAFCREPKPEKVKGQPRVKSSRCFYDGRWYQSKKEMEYAQELDFRVKAGEVLEWKPQHKIEIIVEGKKICNYFIDFLITLKDGSRVYAEVKGWESQLWVQTWKLCMALKDQIDPGAEWIVIK